GVHRASLNVEGESAGRDARRDQRFVFAAPRFRAGEPPSGGVGAAGTAGAAGAAPSAGLLGTTRNRTTRSPSSTTPCATGWGWRKVMLTNDSSLPSTS